MNSTPITGQRQNVWILGVALLLALFFLWGCAERGPDPSSSMTQNDCQQDQALIWLPEGDSVLIGTFQLIGPIADMPEFHDCQRFVVPADASGLASAPSQDGMAFGPLVAIWAANELDMAFARGDPDSVKAVPVAIIYNMDIEHSYKPLGIEPGFSCLFLWKTDTWHARLVALGQNSWRDSEDPSRCLTPIDTIRTGGKDLRSTDLQVRPDTLPEPLTPRDIPPVARWDWDREHRMQYIGIRCGDEWCEIGAPGFTPSEPASDTPDGAEFLSAVGDIPNAPVPTDAEKSRMVAVKGWYDHQRLDLRKEDGTLVMADVSGTVFPQPGLDAVLEDAFEGNWIPSAYVFVDAAYKAKIPMQAGINRVDICHGTASECEVPAGAKHCTGIGVDSPGYVGWWGKVTPGPEDGAPYYYCVRRNEHGGNIIPAAAARWNWSEADAKTWSKCGNACCTGN